MCIRDRKWFHGKKIATSYPGILSGFLTENGVNAEIHVITGSVEVAPGIGLADAIFYIVSSGSTPVSYTHLVAVQAQIQDPVKFNAELKILAADEAEVVFTAAIDKGWHVYSLSLIHI